MLPENEIKRISKFLSLVLRHKPEVIGITLDANGWTDVTTLLEKLAAAGRPIDRATLDHVVATNNKKWFAFDEHGLMIRASQGHSLVVDLGYKPVCPPDVLYHGTADKNRDSILSAGLRKGNRHHVHLSADIHTALEVGRRHGKPVLFEIDAATMHADGHAFTQSDNGVWLADEVPPKYLRIL